MSMKSLPDLVDDLKDDALRNRLGPSLALLAPGNWNGLIGWGAQHGYAFTGADVKALLTAAPGAAAALARNPILRGWSPESLASFVASGLPGAR